MQPSLLHLAVIACLGPFVGGIAAGCFGSKLGRRGAHWVTILGVATALICSIFIFKAMILDKATPFNGAVYTWGISGSFRFDVGFLIDQLTAIMMVTVTFVSLLVHIYSIGYMHDDPGYQRFFAYMSLFTFAMLTLVLANNFLLIFFGWEGVGLVSYLLIGFWFTKETAAAGSLKAFIANRVGDFGFLLGIAAVLDNFGSVDYLNVFAKAHEIPHLMMHIPLLGQFHVVSLISFLLFIGAMGKSAQVPLHVWLPESMEGPTPISALIHAATMVTAGVYMVARMSPLFVLSPAVLSAVMIIGATGALFLGLVGVVQHDIKRVVAYSTISQLGYMMAANGAGAFQAGIFHLMTHACFKALLFLGAGSVIIAMHHEQDMRKMGGLRMAMPITYLTFLVGGLALSAIPPFAGFYSKDAIIEAVHATPIFGSSYAYWCLTVGAFVTALYTFRALFMTFHGKPRFDLDRAKVKESTRVVTIPLILLAIPSTILGALMVWPMLYAVPSLFGKSILVLPSINPLAEIAHHYHGWWEAVGDAFSTLPFWFSVSGIVVAWVCYVKKPELPALFANRFKKVYTVLLYKYGFDDLNDLVFVQGGARLSHFMYRFADMKILDDLIVNGSGRRVTRLAGLVKRIQTGYLYHYALTMIIGLFVFLCWLLLR